MDKKNTMLLTVIAVATLLVAVVGATFAFFSIQGTGNSKSPATVQGTTEDVGAITVSAASKMPSLALKLEHFTDAKEDQTWYSTVDQDGAPAETAQNTPVLTASVEGGGTITYACTATLNVKVTGVEEALKEHSGEVILTLTGLADDVKLESNTEPVTLDLSTYDAEDADQNGKSYSLEFEVASSVSSESPKNIVAADLMIKNTQVDQSGYLANKTFKADITVDKVTCAPKGA